MKYLSRERAEINLRPRDALNPQVLTYNQFLKNCKYSGNFRISGGTFVSRNSQIIFYNNVSVILKNSLESFPSSDHFQESYRL